MIGLAIVLCVLGLMAAVVGFMAGMNSPDGRPPFALWGGAVLFVVSLAYIVYWGFS